MTSCVTGSDGERISETQKVFSLQIEVEGLRIAAFTNEAGQALDMRRSPITPPEASLQLLPYLIL